MELEKRLEQLRLIKADPTYTMRSRRLILAGDELREPLTVWQFVAHSLQFGSAVALAGVLLVLILGGFSTWKFLSPFRLSSLDPSAIRAEAQAVDIQVRLAEVAYPESTVGAADAKPADAKDVASKLAENLGVSSTDPSSPMTVDEALDILMEQ